MWNSRIVGEATVSSYHYSPVCMGMEAWLGDLEQTREGDNYMNDPQVNALSYIHRPLHEEKQTVSEERRRWCRLCPVQVQ